MKRYLVLLLLLACAPAWGATNYYTWDADSTTVPGEGTCTMHSSSIVSGAGHDGGGAMRYNIPVNTGDGQYGCTLTFQTNLGVSITSGATFYYRFWMKIDPAFSWGTERKKMKAARMTDSSSGSGIFTAYIHDDRVEISGVCAGGGSNCVVVPYDFTSAAAQNWQEYIIKVTLQSSCGGSMTLTLYVNGQQWGSPDTGNVYNCDTGGGNAGLAASDKAYGANYYAQFCNGGASGCGGGGIMWVDDLSIDDVYNSNYSSGSAPTITNNYPRVFDEGDIVMLALTTDEDATCKWSTSNVAYSSMGNTFDTTGGTSHSTSLGTLAAGTYDRYWACDSSGMSSSTEQVKLVVRSIFPSSFTEGCEDTSFSNRDWYDVQIPQVTASPVHSGSGACYATWTNTSPLPDSNPAMRRRIKLTDYIDITVWYRRTAGTTQGSHIFSFISNYGQCDNTTGDPEYPGGSATSSCGTFYVQEGTNGRLMVTAQTHTPGDTAHWITDQYSSTNTFSSTSSWYQIRVLAKMVSPGEDWLKAYVNGIEVLNVTGLTIRQSDVPNLKWAQLLYGPSEGSNVTRTMYWDDMLVRTAVSKFHGGVSQGIRRGIRPGVR